MLKRVSIWFAALVIALSALASEAPAQGLVSPGAGAVHRSMAGASTALGVDALGALYWNPAAISSLPRSEVVIGSELILPNIHLGSTVPAGAFGPLGPAETLSGDTRSDSGLVPTTGIGLVYQAEGTGLSIGLGVVTLAAGGVNFPGDLDNPLLAPTGPAGQFFLGANAASAAILAIEPTLSYQITEDLAVGFSPMIDVSIVNFDPAFFGPTTQARLIDPRMFPTGSHTRPFWGGGFRAGATYRLAENLVTGFSFTSPQWFETWKFYARAANGDPLTFETQFTLPMILSWGAAYGGINRLLLALDVRWFDYQTTQLLGEPVRDGGAGWENVWAVALGGRYQLTERMSVQLGYLYNENPVPANLALFNTQLPALVKNTASLGGYYQINDSIGLSAAYVHGFQNSISGTVFQVIGATTTIESEYDSFVIGIHIQFGGSRTPCTSSPCAETSLGS